MAVGVIAIAGDVNTKFVEAGPAGAEALATWLVGVPQKSLNRGSKVWALGNAASELAGAAVDSAVRQKEIMSVCSILASRREF